MSQLGRATAAIVRQLRRAWRTSLGLKVVATLLTVLLVSAVATYLVESRITRARLNVQAHRMLADDLDTVASGMLDRQSDLATSLRNITHSLPFETQGSEAVRSDLLMVLTQFRRSLQLDVLAIITDEGTSLATAGVPLADLPASVTLENTSGPIRLLRATDGRHLQAALVPFSAGDERFLLAGGYLFSDAAAYRLRRTTGTEVVLTADGRVVGTTLEDLDVSAMPTAGDPVSAGAGTIDHGGQRVFVQHQAIARAQGTWAAAGTVGAAMPEPVAGLGRSLGRIRLATMSGLLLLVVGLGALLVRRLSRPLLDLAGTARRIADGDLDVRFEADTDDEIGLLAGTLEGMRQEVRHQLSVIRDQATELEAITGRLVGAQTEERRRLAKDLHDGLQRHLVVLQLRTGMVRSLAESDEVSPEMIDRLLELADAAVEDLRAFSHAIYPSILEDRGLTGALNSLASRCPVPVDLEFDPDPLPRLPAAVEANSYFLISEAVTNALKHAAADTIGVIVGFDGDVLVVTVADDGCGFGDGEGDRSLPDLEDRARVLGGRCQVRSAPGAGTRVRAEIPARRQQPHTSDHEPPGAGTATADAAGRTPQPLHAG